MTDQIYYKVQYPLKKAINMIKEIDTDSPLIVENKGMENEVLEEINKFIDMWEKDGKKNLQNLIKRLRKTQ